MPITVRRILALAESFGTVGLVTLAIAPSALGHAAFVGSDPEPGERLEIAPREIRLAFTEPLNRRLSEATMRGVNSGRDVPVLVRAVSGKALVLRPRARLPRGAYEVEWRTVSPKDGHRLEGSFSFGVRAPAVGGEQTLEQSPLARGGWLRVASRVLLYGALLSFAGALLLEATLSRRPDSWLVPRTLGGHTEIDIASLRDRQRSLVGDLGWLAVGASCAAIIAESADAAGELSLAGARDFLLDNTAGLARLAVVAFLMVAVLAWERRPRLGALGAALALGAVAVSGHAGSASPRSLAILNDWVHLVAGSLWLGGIVAIVLVWRTTVRRGGRALRIDVVSHVLPRFGGVALPAFLVVAATGVASLLIQLGRLSALWETPYGRVLAVKVALVAALMAVSYLHARRLRPRLLKASPETADAVERRHWRLLRAEPLIGLSVVAAAALLVAFPLPPRQLGEAAQAVAAPAPCNPCPLPRPTRGELAVAEHAGSQLVAGWLRRDGPRLSGTVRVFDRRRRPAATPARVLAARQRSCGRGCLEFSGALKDTVEVAVTERGRRYLARLPARWRRGQAARARAILARAEAAMRRLRSAREIEEATSGPGSYGRIDYRLQAPDRFAYRTNGKTDNVVIGRRQWFRPNGEAWQRSTYGAGLPFRTRSWFRWSPYAQAIRLLAVGRKEGRRVADVALMDPGTPAWIRLTIDLERSRVLRERMIAPGHYMNRRYFDFNQAVTIRPPDGP